MIEVLGIDEIQAAITWPMAVESLRDTLMDLARGQVLQPEPVELLLPDGGELHIKSAYRVGSTGIVIKVATGGLPGALPDGCYVILDPATGSPKWLLSDGGWLTQARTAAAGVLATQTFARAEATDLVVIGTGGLARALVEAHQAVMPNLGITVWGRDRDSARRLAKDAHIESADDLAATLKAADVVITATNSRAPLFDADWIHPGTHVTGMGADTVGKQELPVALLSRAAVLASDDPATAVISGDCQHLAAEGRTRLRSWPHVLLETVPGRTSADQTTIADLCGIGAEDAAIAGLAIRHRSG